MACNLAAWKSRMSKEFARPDLQVGVLNVLSETEN